MTTPPKPDAPKVPARIARFRIDEELARDAEGVLYAAFDEVEKRKVQLRVLPDAIAHDPDRAKRVVEEAQATALLAHPNLQPLLDAIDAPLAVAYEPRAGAPLRKRIEGSGAIDVAESLRIAMELTSAAGVLHRAGLVHGAIDDEHVLLHDDGRATLIGAGLSELRPEAAVDARSDVHAIAALLHAMIAGRRATARDGARLAAIGERGIPAKLTSLLDRATDPDRTRRPADADALLAALTDVDLPVEPVGESAAATREDVAAGSSPLWVIGASLALALVIALAIAVVITQS